MVSGNGTDMGSQGRRAAHRRHPQASPSIRPIQISGAAMKGWAGMRCRRRLRAAGILVVLTLAAGGCAGGSSPRPTVPDFSIPPPSLVPPATATAEPSAASTPAAQSPAAGPPSPFPAQPGLPAGALTIVALGDSLTESQGDDSGSGGYPGRLEKLIAGARPGSKILNLGHSGWTSTNLIRGQDGQPSELATAMEARPNAALVWVGSNDLWNLYEFGPDPMTADAEGQDLGAYRANLDTILSELAGRGVIVYVALLDDQSKRPVVAHPNPTEPAFPGTSAADLTLMSAHVAAYNETIRAEAARYGATTVDFSHSTIFTDAATLYGDGNHPNDAGYDLVARVWFAALEPTLE
jgi:lysophospholipase L1-like esterase